MEGLARFFNDLLLQHQTSVHASQRGEELISCMEASGFRKEGLPACIGGSWNYAYFSQWLADRIRLERDRYKLFYPASASTSNPAPSSDPEEDHPLKKRRIHYSPTNNSINNDTGQGMQGSRDQTQELGQLVEQLPNANAFKDARRSAPPEIWTFESNLEAFLRVENFDSQQAAKRVAQYWSLRAKYFGPKRFEPLHQTGEAALRRKDLSILITGFITLLPNDADGCAVLWIDGSRLPEGSVDANRDRCLFYMFSLLAETEQSQKKGAVLLYRMDDSSTVSNIPSDVLEQLASSLPIRFKAVHLVSQRPISSDITASMSFGNHLYIHIGTSKEELSHKLETFGLRKENLPRYLNGDWGYSKFIQWQELRTRMEWRVPLGLSGREASLARFPTLRPFDALPDAEREERSRRLNVMHCRRKKYRILVETDLLREQAKELEDEQEELQKENKKLQELLLKAIALEQELVDKTK